MFICFHSFVYLDYNSLKITLFLTQLWKSSPKRFHIKWIFSSMQPVANNFLIARTEKPPRPPFLSISPELLHLSLTALPLSLSTRFYLPHLTFHTFIFIHIYVRKYVEPATRRSQTYQLWSFMLSDRSEYQTSSLLPFVLICIHVHMWLHM